MYSLNIVVLLSLVSMKALKYRRAIAILVSGTTCKILGQMLNSWNFNISVFFLAFKVGLSY